MGGRSTDKGRCDSLSRYARPIDFNGESSLNFCPDSVFFLLLKRKLGKKWYDAAKAKSSKEVDHEVEFRLGKRVWKFGL
ncbi:hypothetical protein Csa_012249 [Cucumis sativus]|uniref:Uncharacterized protein n=1 Tax=Cucumis sativus TaxID=3659 RepID=A0A0A0L1J5_CUCSA|nr:hypothetical protein Csa_012249 [Cucumis sativus]